MTAAAQFATMPHEQQQELLRAACADADRDYRKDGWLWMIEQVWTRDEAAQEVKRWPDLGYLRELWQYVDEEPLVALPKSRRMKVTWLIAGYCVHRARYERDNAIYIQSETEEKAAFVVNDRCKFIEERLHNPLLRRPYSEIRTNEGMVGKLTYKQTGSSILAIPEGDAKIRAFTPSILVMDESEYQRRGHQALVAALSTVEQRSKLIVLSSSAGPLGVLAGICREAGFTRFTG